MFTGIVEELGTVASVEHDAEGARIAISARDVLADLTVGGSVAVNGCCLTAVTVGPEGFSADAVAETLRRTSLGSLAAGDPVNLERPLRVDGRLDGHLVQGHVDATGTIVAVVPTPEGSLDLTIEAPGEVLRYLVEKGSVAVDGVSLTVVGVADRTFTLAIIPHTASVTTLGAKAVGALVNLEIDVVAKYVERLTPPRQDGAPGAPSNP